MDYADSMSGFNKKFRKFTGKDRPIHSTDLKRLKFMVKKQTDGRRMMEQK